MVRQLSSGGVVIIAFHLIFLFQVQLIDSKTYLQADGTTDTYKLIDTIFGGGNSAIEVPDCNHTSVGPHITQQFDDTLKAFVFAFHSHIREDDDRCVKFDRQRTEIKTNDNLPTELTGHYGDEVTLSWDFKLDEGFLPPYSFCHIHQLKAVGGDDSMPIITITTRKSNPNELQLLQYDSFGALHFLMSTPLQPFLGTWVHVASNITYCSNGSYDIKIIRVLDGELLLSYQNDSIDFWRNDTTFIRPKWGLYRSVQEYINLVLSRDETVLFHNFCVGKGTVNVCL